MDGGAWWAAVHGVARSWTQLSNFTFTFHFHALEKEMATHSSVLAWRIPGTGEFGGLPSLGSHRVGHDWGNLAAAAAGCKSKESSSSGKTEEALQLRQRGCSNDTRGFGGQEGGRLANRCHPEKWPQTLAKVQKSCPSSLLEPSPRPCPHKLRCHSEKKRLMQK